ncbi:MAG: hypothetical protein H0W14_02560 [Actinobacteria bacterium]|nr:hypothetical protein [Actinomycetota bacterium]
MPRYLLLGLTSSLPGALAGTLIVGAATGATTVLVTAACQESVPAEVLGRVMGLSSWRRSA